MKRISIARVLGVFTIIGALMLGTPQRSEAMVGAGIAGIIISESPAEACGAIPVILAGLLVGYIFGNPIALIVDGAIEVENGQIITALAGKLPFIDDQELTSGFAKRLKTKFDANTDRGLNLFVALSDEEIEAELAKSSQLFDAEEIVAIKRVLQ